jgi:hypothetical protein
MQSISRQMRLSRKMAAKHSPQTETVGDASAPSGRRHAVDPAWGAGAERARIAGVLVRILARNYFLKKGLDTGIRGALQGDSAWMEKPKSCLFSICSKLTKSQRPVCNVRTISLETDKNNGLELSTSVEKPVDNWNVALDADWLHPLKNLPRDYRELTGWTACG